MLRPQTIMIGRLGSDPEVIEGDTYTLCRISLAVNHGYYDKEGQFIEKTDWFSLEAWNERAKALKKNFKMGQQAAFRVQIQDGSYEDPTGGKRVFKTNFIISEMKRLERRESGKTNDSNTTNSFTQEDISF